MILRENVFFSRKLRYVNRTHRVHLMILKPYYNFQFVVYIMDNLQITTNICIIEKSIRAVQRCYRFLMRIASVCRNIQYLHI